MERRGPARRSPNRWSSAFADALRGSGRTSQTGVFGADMAVELVNDGPVTVLLEL